MQDTVVEVINESPVVEVINESPIIEVIDEYIDIIEVGVQGPPGLGMIPGGNVGDVISKKSDIDYDCEWIENPYITVVKRYDSDDDGKVDHAEFADLAENSNFIDGKDINDYYNKDQVDFITRKYTYNQPTPSVYWVLNHNLNRYPNVIITDSAGSVIEGSVIYTNLNTAVIQFNIPVSGKASLS